MKKYKEPLGNGGVNGKGDGRNKNNMCVGERKKTLSPFGDTSKEKKGTVLQSALVARFAVSCIQNFFSYSFKILKSTFACSTNYFLDLVL